jgi:hypothetical protein
MRRAGLKPVWKRKFVHTTDSKHELPIAGNVLARQFNPAAPNKAYVSDITYIRTGAGWPSLAVVIDLSSRKVVGRAMAPSMPPSWSAMPCTWRFNSGARQLGWSFIRTVAVSMQVLSIRRYWPAMASSAA